MEDDILIARFQANKELVKHWLADLHIIEWNQQY